MNGDEGGGWEGGGTKFVGLRFGATGRGNACVARPKSVKGARCSCVVSLRGNLLRGFFTPSGARAR